MDCNTVGDGVGVDGVDSDGAGSVVRVAVTCGAGGVGARCAGGVDKLESGNVAVAGIECIGIDAVGTRCWRGVDDVGDGGLCVVEVKEVSWMSKRKVPGCVGVNNGRNVVS